MKRVGGSAAILFFLSATAVVAQSRVEVGRAVTVDSPVLGRVVLVGGSAVIRTTVSGDVVSWGGRVELRPGASIGGDLVSFGGAVEGNTTAVRGKILTAGSLSNLYLAEVTKSPFVGGAIPFRTWAGLRVFVLAVWLLAAALILRFASSAICRTTLCLERETGVAALTGVLTVALLFLTAMAAVAALPPAVRVIIPVAVAALAAGLKIFGMAAIFLLLGQKILRDETPARRTAALTLGLIVAGAASLIPVVGPVLWSAGSVLAVGAAAYTRFGSPRWRVALA